MGLFSFIGGILGGNSQKKAVKKATKAQEAAMNKAIAEQQRQFDVTQANFEPWRQAGLSGLGGLGDLIGINGGEKQDASIAALKESPFFKRLYATGEESVLANASATGGLRGGNTQGSLFELGENTLLDVISSQLSSLGGLAGMGMGATESVANFGAAKANNVSSLLKGIGEAKASGYLARGGIANQMWSNAGSFLDQAASAIAGGAGGGGLGGFLKSMAAGGF